MTLLTELYLPLIPKSTCINPASYITTKILRKENLFIYLFKTRETYLKILYIPRSIKRAKTKLDEIHKNCYSP